MEYARRCRGGFLSWIGSSTWIVSSGLASHAKMVRHHHDGEAGHTVPRQFDRATAFLSMLHYHDDRTVEAVTYRGWWPIT